MNYKTTEELETYIKALYEKLRPMAEKDGIYRPLHVFFSNKTYDDGTYCYADEKGYHFYWKERWDVSPVETTGSLLEVAYRILRSPVFNLASSYEVKNRIETEDFRRLLFAKELELWGEIGEEYRQRAAQDIEKILAQVPYED